MHIVHVSAELAPVAKVGGLGDVVFGLARQLQKAKHHIEIILPKYDTLCLQHLEELQELPFSFSVQQGGCAHQNRMWQAKVMGLNVLLIQPDHPAALFERGGIYGYNDDVERFLYFSRAALEFLHTRGDIPDIIHTHDWQTAAIAPLFTDQYRDKKWAHCAVLQTLHNLEHQGQCHPWQIQSIGMDPSHYQRADRLMDDIQPEKLNLLKGSIVYANRITTVSPTYAQEALEATGGRGLENTLRQHIKRFSGILNGIDTDYWNPATDSLLPAHYSLSNNSPKENGQLALRNKRLVKQHLQQTLGLAHAEEKPLVAVVSRLVPQKGIHLIRHGIYRSLELGAQYVLLGSSPIPQIQAEFQTLREEFSQSPHVRIEMTQSESLAHLIFAGSDILLVPSLFEPCGLTQLIAMRYGTVPVVRRTGGLADTVFDVDYAELPFAQRNGYTFEHTDEQALNSALDRAIHCWKHHPEQWWQIVRNGMAMDHSWQKATKAYEALYREICPNTATRAMKTP